MQHSYTKELNDLNNVLKETAASPVGAQIMNDWLEQKIKKAKNSSWAWGWVFGAASQFIIDTAFEYWRKK